MHAATPGSGGGVLQRGLTNVHLFRAVISLSQANTLPLQGLFGVEQQEGERGLGFVIFRIMNGT